MTIIVSFKKAVNKVKYFFKYVYETNRNVVKEGSILDLGKHTLTFVEAPTVHWIEVIIFYSLLIETLISADSFIIFGSIFHDEAYNDESRKFFFGIVGNYGSHVEKIT